MNFEEYLQITVPKIGPNGAFDLSRDAKYKALERVLVEKGIATEEEINAELEKQLGETAKNISKMPPIPNNKPTDGGVKE